MLALTSTLCEENQNQQITSVHGNVFFSSVIEKQNSYRS